MQKIVESMNPLEVQVDRSLPTPLYVQIANALQQAIQHGQIAPGTALPSEREFAVSLGVSRMTIRKAFEELVSTSFAEQRPGSGTYVLPRRVRQKIKYLQGFTDEAHALGCQPGSTVLAATCITADDEIAAALRIGRGKKVFQIVRLRTMDGLPLAVQHAHLTPQLQNFPMKLFHETGSLYQTILAHYGIVPYKARQSVTARMPNQDEADLLVIPLTVPVLSLERTSYASDGVPFEHVKSTYRSDRYQMILELYAAGLDGQKID